MRAIVEKRITDYKRERENHEFTRVEPIKPGFKVVVNNYRQQEKEIADKINGDTDKMMAPLKLGLPSQPTRYLKYPEYDWF
jgi:hypothetical protein